MATKQKFPLLTKKDLVTLELAIYYMNMAELKKSCEQLGLPSVGKKADLIARIITFITSGDIITIAPIPQESRAQKGKEYPLAPSTPILFGSYKNDLATRLFMKKLVGEHFHFTAFGIDWLNERWMKKNPPTYQEFAQFWETEHQARKKRKATPKQEWAYLNFIQRYLAQDPQATRTVITKEWNKFRAVKAREAQAIINTVELS